MVKSKRGSMFKAFGLFVLCLSVLLMGSITAFAGNDPAAEMNSLSTGVQTKLNDESYKMSGGGSLKGSDLFESYDYTNSNNGNSNGGYTINESNFNKLTSSEQSRFVSDIAKESYDIVDDDSTAYSDVTEETVEDWWRELQAIDGVGSKFLNVVLENTKPDFVSANRIYKPFSGLVGTVMGLIAVVGMGLLGIVLVADIFYIVIPPVRLFVDENSSGDGKGGKLPVSKIFSNDAIRAVKMSEEQSDGGGNNKQALGIYLGRRVPMLILLGICLLYLVSGQIYILVGHILDLVSGFLGF